MPFRPFFLLAGLDALLGVGVWVPVILGWPDPASAAGAWHARELLLGAVPLVIAGFLRTALPRWTGRGPGCPWAWRLLAPLWLAGRAASPWLPPGVPPGAPPSGALFLAVLAVLVLHQVAARADRRNGTVAALVCLLAGAALADPGGGGTGWLHDPAGRAVLAAILGLIMVLGGRIAPSLAASQLGLGDASRLFTARRSVETTVGALAGAALALWVVAPDSAATGPASALAAVAQAARLVQWRGWRLAGTPAVFALHLAYACVPLGFALLAGHGLRPDRLPLGAAVHVWAVGAIGLMCVAVMSSMIRKHSGHALAHSPLTTASHGLLFAACALRLGAEFAAGARPALLLGAAAAWAGGMALFLVAFRPALLAGRMSGQAVERIIPS